LLDSKGRVYTLGVNTAGQLGTSKDVNTFHPDPTQIATLSGKNIVQIACGDKHTGTLHTQHTTHTHTNNKTQQTYTNNNNKNKQQ